MTRPYRAALLGFLLAMPFVVMNFIVGFKPEPIYSFLESIGFISASPVPLVPILILLGLLGSLITAWPLLQRAADGKRHVYILNTLLAATLFIFFVWVAIGLGEEIYRCDILHIPNCD